MDIVERLLEKPYRRGDENNDQAALRRQAEREEAAAEIERLREIENDWQAMRDERDAARTGYDCLLGENRDLVKLEAENERLRVEIERLRIENIQMRFALGYPMPSDLERHIIPANPFKCGICDAIRALSSKTEDERG